MAQVVTASRGHGLGWPVCLDCRFVSTPPTVGLVCLQDVRREMALVSDFLVVLTAAAAAAAAAALL